jgi:RNA polymerase-binding transcription factor DksA
MDTAHYRAILVARRQELQARLTRIEADLDAPGNPDDDDRALERNNDDVLESLGGSGQTELLAIEAALSRMAAGTFGACVRCGDTISPARLATVPQAALCERCMKEI